MTIQSINTMSAAPVPGRFYMVPSVKFEWLGWHREMLWPIIGPPHNDLEFFNFEDVHWHVDIRFLTAAHLLHAGGVNVIEGKPIPLKMLDGQRPVLRRFRCHDNIEKYHHADSPSVQNLNSHFSGRQSIAGRHGWVCPHQNVPVGTMAPDADGIITCPLHGLRIDALTGRCVGPLAAGREASA